MGAGLFITVEGADGAGKTTQLARLKARLGDLGREVVVTREPGGTPAGERLRALLLGPDAPDWSAKAEALLMYAARDAHLAALIRPALARGAVVLCDRFLDSTRAYQGLAGGVDQSLLRALETAIVGDTMPDLTLILDLDPAAAEARASARRGGGEVDRIEARNDDFRRTLRAAFLTIAAAEPGRCRVIDAGVDEDAVAGAIWAHVGPLAERP
jgi:dTMP kinase